MLIRPPAVYHQEVILPRTPQSIVQTIPQVLLKSLMQQSPITSLQKTEFQRQLPPKTIWSVHRQPEWTSASQISLEAPDSGVMYTKIVADLRKISEGPTKLLFAKYPNQNLIQTLDDAFQNLESAQRPRFLDRLSENHPELHRAFLESLINRCGIAETHGLPEPIVALGRAAIAPTYSATQKLINIQTLIIGLKRDHPTQYEFIKTVALLCHEKWALEPTDKRISDLSKALAQWFGKDVAILLIRFAHQISKLQPQNRTATQSDLLDFNEIHPDEEATTAANTVSPKGLKVPPPTPKKKLDEAVSTIPASTPDAGFGFNEVFPAEETDIYVAGTLVEAQDLRVRGAIASGRVATTTKHQKTSFVKLNS